VARAASGRASQNRHGGGGLGQGRIEIDCDGHRSGLGAGDDALLDVARLVADGGELRGLLT
jgi:hypothetical protein